MTDLYFNDCLPSSFDSTSISVLHELRGMKSLMERQGIAVNNGIILSSSADNVMINGISLKKHIISLPIEEKKWFLSCFYMRQNIEEYINQYESEDSIKYLYDCTFNDRDANNLAAAGIMGFMALSIPVEEELKTNALSIHVVNPDNGMNEDSILVNNYHGKNLQYALGKLIPAGTTLLEVLKRKFNCLGKNCYITPEFENTWQSINTNFKNGIVSRFDDAIKAGLIFPPKYDNNIVKMDTNETGVFELREKAHCLRIYFKSGYNSIVIGWYGTKTKFYGADQSSDFKYANTIIDEYINKYKVSL